MYYIRFWRRTLLGRLKMTAEMKVGTEAEARLIINAARLGNIEQHLVTLDFEPATGSPYRSHQMAESNRRKSNRGCF